MRNVILVVSISCLTLSAVPASRAQEETQPRVARLSLIEGEASLLRGDDTTSWVSAAVNTPLVMGDYVSLVPIPEPKFSLIVITSCAWPHRPR